MSNDERTVVHLVRHGEVDNPTKVLYGRLPGFGLSARGERQAKAAATYLGNRPIRAVWASPLERARQTAEPIAAEHDLSVDVDHRLIESSNVFEGTSVASRRAFVTDLENWKHLRNPFRPSWGEPYDEVAERVLAAVDDARDAYPGGEVVLVSHQLPIFVTRRLLEGRPLWHRPDRRQCALGSVTSLVYDGERLAYLYYVEPSGPGESKQGNVGA